MAKIAPPGPIVTDFQKAKAGDVLDTGLDARYRYLLLSKAPVYRADNMWVVAGRRWIFSRQSFAVAGISFWTKARRPVSDDEVKAYIAKLTADDIAAGIE